jgi:hypothetical protein
MEKETLKNIFDFLEEKENKKHKDSRSLKWKLFFNKSITKGDLNVEGNLDLRYCTDLTSLPKNLKVGGYLNLYNTKITSLPEGLYLDGNLYIGWTELEKYTDKQIKDMIEPGFIKGSIIRAFRA